MPRLLATQLGPEIRVNAVAPGLIETPWYDRAEEVWENSCAWISANAPLRGVGSPLDVAEAVASPARAAYTTGDAPTLEGGRHVA
ncbi:SDR family NAD(P)-dependent oxidoreductase [Streptomyces barringtoniae]|uniref:SDR family NAD(P)-dependent oxidoreductase n=1 Tax=Streptomyces barringtoniae TaxID=2892029 RepID=UPI001E46119F|nr:SDR family oxidoreductase [Streptomyces barringtoniae]MCC5477649.1 SDR family oxidoreductase [Streptomyces barringtoniae]